MLEESLGRRPPLALVLLKMMVGMESTREDAVAFVRWQVGPLFAQCLARISMPISQVAGALRQDAVEAQVQILDGCLPVTSQEGGESAVLRRICRRTYPFTDVDEAAAVLVAELRGLGSLRVVLAHLKARDLSDVISPTPVEKRRPTRSCTKRGKSVSYA